MRFPLRHGARQGESKAGKETVRAQTSVPQAQTSARTKCLSLLIYNILFFYCSPLLKCKATILPVSNVPITLRISDVTHPASFEQQNMNDNSEPNYDLR